MAANVGSQSISVKYHDPVNSDIVNSRFYGVHGVGLLKGGYCTYSGADLNVTVSRLICEIRDVNGLINQIRMSTGASVTVTVSSAATYVIMRWAHVEAEATDYVEFLAATTPGQHDIIIAKATVVGSAVTGVSYAERTFANDRGSFCKVVPSYPTASTTKVNMLPGVVRTASGYTLVEDQYGNGEVNLAAFGAGYVYVYMTTAGAIGTSSTLGGCAGHILLARVNKDGYNIEADHITDLRAFLSPPMQVDGTTIGLDGSGQLYVIGGTFEIQARVVLSTSYTTHSGSRKKTAVFRATSDGFLSVHGNSTSGGSDLYMFLKVGRVNPPGTIIDRIQIISDATLDSAGGLSAPIRKDDYFQVFFEDDAHYSWQNKSMIFTPFKSGGTAVAV